MRWPGFPTKVIYLRIKTFIYPYQSKVSRIQDIYRGFQIRSSCPPKRQIYCTWKLVYNTKIFFFSKNKNQFIINLIKSILFSYKQFTILKGKCNLNKVYDQFRLQHDASDRLIGINLIVMGSTNQIVRNEDRISTLEFHIEENIGNQESLNNFP
jgi:hypothetical protein